MEQCSPTSTYSGFYLLHSKPSMVPLFVGFRAVNRLDKRNHLIYPLTVTAYQSYLTELSNTFSVIERFLRRILIPSGRKG